MWEQILGVVMAWLAGPGLSIVVALALMVVLMALSRVLLRRFRKVLVKREESGERIKRIDTIVAVARHLAVGVILAVTLLMILSELGLDLAPILTAVGITGLAISFGAQSLVKDVISGLFILLENQVRVGDAVELAGHSGAVEAINLRTIRLRDFEGNLHVVPNGSVGAMTNKTKDYSRKAIEIDVAYSEDIGRVVETLRQIGEEVRGDPQFSGLITEPLEVFGLVSFSRAKATVRARVTTLPGEQWAIEQEIKRRIKERFDELGIEIP